MNRLFKNFKKLSAKQIKTYAAVVLISALSFEAIALSTEEEPIPQPGMIDMFETSPIAELPLESWMLSPFELIIDESPAIEAFAPAPSVELFETELALESWMLSPFEVSIEEGPAIEALTPAPSLELFETELVLESWMALPFEINDSEESAFERSTCSPAP